MGSARTFSELPVENVSAAAGKRVASSWTIPIACALVTDDPKRPRNRHDLGRVFNEVPELYDRVRPGYPDEVFADLVAVTGLDEASVLEVGCGTGQAARSLAALGCSVTAVEPGADMAALARQRLASFRNVDVERSTFEGVGRPRSTLRCSRGCVIVALGRPVDRPAASARRTFSRWLDGAARPCRCPPAGRAGGVRTERRSARAVLPREPRLGSSTAGGRGAHHQRGSGPGRRSRRIVRPDDRAMVSNRSVVQRGRLRRSPSLMVAVSQARPGCPRASARRHRRAHPHANGRPSATPLPEPSCVSDSVPSEASDPSLHYEMRPAISRKVGIPRLMVVA
ncbi:class I SAM-dependent methyltransferase [Streptomyces hygroscopicus]|uniref:class I SAM-dependent methyltransferase n=1 Tax=Streptomyces hygroscopicus TaxID=1912 RepID=UPI0033C43DBA